MWNNLIECTECKKVRLKGTDLLFIFISFIFSRARLSSVISYLLLFSFFFLSSSRPPSFLPSLFSIIGSFIECDVATRMRACIRMLSKAREWGGVGRWEEKIEMIAFFFVLSLRFCLRDCRSLGCVACFLATSMGVSWDSMRIRVESIVHLSVFPRSSTFIHLACTPLAKQADRQNVT